MVWWLVIVVAAIVVAAAWLHSEPFTPAPAKKPRDPAQKTFSWTPGPSGTYVFGDPPFAGSPLDAELNRALATAVDAYVPRDVLDGAGEPKPLPAPHVATQAEDVAREALARVARHVPDRALDLVSVEWSAAAADANENLTYELSLMAYDQRRNVAVKLALAAMVTPAGRTYVKSFRTFNRAPADLGPDGLDVRAAPAMAAYIPDLGIDYEALYPV